MLDDSIWRHRTVCLLIGKTSGGSNALCKEICWCLVWIWLPFIFYLLVPSSCMLWCYYSALKVFLSAKVMLLSFYYLSYNWWRIMWNITKHGLFITKKPAVRATAPFSHQRVWKANTVSSPKSSPASLGYIELLGSPSFQLFFLCAFDPCLTILGRVCNSWTGYNTCNTLWSSWGMRIFMKR